MLRRSLFSQIFCKGTKNIIDKRIILSIFASVLSIIKEVYDPTTTEIHRGHRPPATLHPAQVHPSLRGKLSHIKL